MKQNYIKNITFLLLFLLTFLAFGQRHRELVKFEAKTSSGGLVFGVAYTKSEANTILNDFQKRNKGSKYDISKAEKMFRYTTLQIKNKYEDPVKTFRGLSRKHYKVLSAEDLKALELIDKKSFTSAVNYYMNARQAEKDFVINRFANLTVNFSKFRY